MSENLSFFSQVYLLEIDQAQLKNSNYDVLLSTWLISMEISPKAIFISIWCLPVQMKAHKENIRAKHETSEECSENTERLYDFV